MNDRELTILQHLAELRRRVIISVLALLVGSAVSWAFFRQLIELLVRPARDLEAAAGGQLIFTEVTEMLTTSIKVSFVAGFVIAMPIILYQVIMFTAPGLIPKERRYLLAFLPAALVAFAAGVAFGYFVLTPPALHFLLTFAGDVAVPMIKVSNIVNLMIRLLFWMGLAFETPLVMYLLAQLGLVNARKLSPVSALLAGDCFYPSRNHYSYLRPDKPGPGGPAADSSVRIGDSAGPPSGPGPEGRGGYDAGGQGRLNQRK